MFDIFPLHHAHLCSDYLLPKSDTAVVAQTRLRWVVIDSERQATDTQTTAPNKLLQSHKSHDINSSSSLKENLKNALFDYLRTSTNFRYLGKKQSPPEKKNV